MDSLKEITVFSIGDSKELKTWSNVPYFFTKTLEAKNVKVNRVNIEENRFLNAVYKYTVYAFLKIFYPNSNHTYFRSGLNYFATNLKIKKALKEFPKAEALIFLTYSFSAGKISDKKIILFSDWSYLYLIKTFLKRESYWFEKTALQREKEHIDKADLVLSLFPKSFEFNLQHYQNKNCLYLGNVINSEYPLNKEHLLELKLTSSKFLFIGNKKYIKGAVDLINAFKELDRNKNTNAELHIIGLNENDTNIKLPGLYYHGYLDKGDVNENKTYYQLISTAKVIINTNPGWGAFSAMTECMYYYTPVITTPYEEFVETYGKEIDFGYYLKSDSTGGLTDLLGKMLHNDESVQLALMKSAHEKVKEFTWERYADKLLRLIS
jgi:glycosyltransferase involved in cell wall biosynthesis